MAKKARYFAIVPAAGIGTRMRSEVAKQYLKIQDRTILEITLSKLLSVKPELDITVCTSVNDQYWQTLHQSVFSQCDRISNTDGGATRANSVLNGLAAVKASAKDDDWVLVHDAARPCFSIERVEAMLEQLRDHPVGGILAEPVKDTLKRQQPSATAEIQETVAREGLWQAQTPQMFRFGILWQAYQQAVTEIDQITDEASAVERLGLSPRLMVSDSSNIKITAPADLQLAEYCLALEQNSMTG